LRFSGQRERQPPSTSLLMAPGLGWLVVFMVMPSLLVLVVAFFERGVYGGVDWAAPTFENFQRAIDPLYATIFLDSASVAGAATLIALVIGYPAAYAITLQPARRQTALLFLAMLPFWTNYLIRTYAWIVLLHREGLISRVLIGAGLASEPLPILYNSFAVVLGLVYNYVPFVILAVYSALQRLDPAFAEASRDLGAGPWVTFVRITLPLTAAGVAAGAVFVFVLSIGNFVTPDLLGGGKVQMVGNLIYDQFLSARDWPFGAALSMVLMAVMMVLLFINAVVAAGARGRRHA
jgi:spermidine/putrescine transport system permease protein